MKPPDSLYREITSMEPLLPQWGAGELAELSVEIFRKSGQLSSTLPSPEVRASVAALVREMNSYYSNLIEGHKTLPREIERALRDDFSGAEDQQRNQRLSVAHIRTETAMRDRLARDPDTQVYSAGFISWLHAQFYHHLPEQDWFTTSQSGKRHSVTPGRWRDHQVVVGRHTPPDHQVIGDFLARFHTSYSAGTILATERLTAVAAAHHRLVWIHPFGDANGRVARLQSHAAMITAGLDGAGLWTLSRGLARARPDYYARLQAADQTRIHDFDGRGNLSDRALSEWCRFFLHRILDQIEFMTELIAPFSLIDRIESYLLFRRVDLEKKLRGHLARLLKALCLEGEIKRGQVAGILGLKGTAAREVIRRALEERLIESSSDKGPLRIAFPEKVIESYFPNLFADLPVDPE